MKVLNAKNFAIAGAIALGLTSCDKDVDTSKLTLENSRTATIKIYAYGELDKKADKTETLQASFIVSAKNKDFNSESAKGSYLEVYKTNADGVVTITVPTTNDGVEYTITPIDVELSQTQSVGSVDETIKKIYKANETTVKVKSEDVKIQQFVFKEEAYKNEAEYINIALYMNGEFNVEKAGNEAIPDDITSLTFIEKDKEGKELGSIVVSSWETVTSPIKAEAEADPAIKYSKVKLTVRKDAKLYLKAFNYSRKKLSSDDKKTTFKYDKFVSSALYESITNEEAKQIDLGTGTEQTFVY